MTIPFGYRSRPVSAVQPFTYSDGDTYLIKLERLVRWLTELIAAVNEHGEQIADLEAEMVTLQQTVAAELLKAGIYTDTQIDKLRAELQALIGTISAEGTAFNPTNGHTHEGFSKVIGDVYDNLRYFGLFATEYDAMGLTVAEYDALELTARKYDLTPFRSDNNAVLEDD